MRRVFAVLAACAAALGLALGAPVANADNPVTPVDGGTVTSQCYAQLSTSVDDPGYKFCRTIANAEEMAAAVCRLPLYSAPDASAPDYCGVFDGREVSEARIAAYENSWVHRALSLQRGLDADAPLMEEQIPHTHNSFNASSYMLPDGVQAPSYYPTLTNQDPNQVYSITDQLRMDVRAIEIDLHWVPSPYAPADGSTHGYWVTVCHGDGEDPTGQGFYVHAGCTYDRPMQDTLAEVRRWLDANPGQFLLIYFENQLYPGGPIASQQQAHDVAASLIQQAFATPGGGSLVYEPPASLQPGDCASMPYDETRADMLAQGKRVLIVGNCGPGAWNHWVFSRGPKWDESGDATTYTAADCAKDEAARESHSSFRRYFEERTWLEAVTFGAPGPLAGKTSLVTPATTAELVRCGANIIGFDQLEPFDGRLAALVWSWADGLPSDHGGDCAYQASDGRFRQSGCGTPRHFACVDAHLDWHVTSAAGPWSGGFATCPAQFPGSTYGVPPNGYRNAQLAAAAPPGPRGVWLDYRRVGDTWVAHASASARPGPRAVGYLRRHPRADAAHHRGRRTDHRRPASGTARPGDRAVPLAAAPVASISSAVALQARVAGVVAAVLLALLLFAVRVRRRRMRLR